MGHARGPRSRVRLPAGEYVVGDPCYLLPDGVYETWIDTAEDTLPDDDLLVADVDGHRVAACHINGDSDFTDQEGREYGEDSGLLGAIPLAVAVQDDEYTVGLVHRVDFPTDFDVYVSEHAIHIGHITIEVIPDAD